MIRQLGNKDNKIILWLFYFKSSVYLLDFVAPLYRI